MIAKRSSAVPFPSEMPADEFSDFRTSKLTRKSIGRFRELAGALIKPQAPAHHVVEEIVDQYEEYKAEVKRMRVRTHFNVVKFVITSAAGVVEDILKLRVESLVKRPFEMAEWFADNIYTTQGHEASPFYFLIEKDKEVSR